MTHPTQAKLTDEQIISHAIHALPGANPFSTLYEFTAVELCAFARAIESTVSAAPTQEPAAIYPSSSEGTIRCTCEDYPHREWCGRIDPEGVLLAERFHAARALLPATQEQSLREAAGG